MKKASGIACFLSGSCYKGGLSVQAVFFILMRYLILLKLIKISVILVFCSTFMGCASLLRNDYLDLYANMPSNEIAKIRPRTRTNEIVTSRTSWTPQLNYIWDLSKPDSDPEKFFGIDHSINLLPGQYVIQFKCVNYKVGIFSKNQINILLEAGKTYYTDCIWDNEGVTIEMKEASKAE